MADDFKAVVAQVKMAHDIVDYVGSHGVQLKQAGNKFKGLCPFHNDSNPSLILDSSFQNYKCWGCGASGDLIKYVQLTENLEFFDALKKLAEDKNITLNIKEEKDGVDYKSLREAMRAVSNFFYNEYRKLDPSHPARNEVSKVRGLSETKMMYGYAPEGRQTLYNHMKAKGFSDEVILLTGACTTYEGRPGIYDFWSGRLMFYITDVVGKPIAYSGRKLYESDKRGKYVNSKDGVLFDKGASLFNISYAKKMAGDTKKVFVCEGQFDVGAFVEAGMENAVASSGTAFTERQALMLRRLVSEDGRIVFAFDGDAAGIRAASKVFTTAPIIHGQAYVLPMPEGQDPCDYRLEHGNEALAAFAEEKTVPLVEFVLDNLAKGFDMKQDLEVAKYVEDAAKVLKGLTSDILRETYIKKVALDSFISVDTVRRSVAAARVDAPQPTIHAVATDEGPEETAPEGDLKARMGSTESTRLGARLLALALEDTSFAPRLLPLNLPDLYASLVTELQTHQGPIVPETFTDTELVQLLIDTRFFPLGHLLTDETRLALFDHLETEYRTGVSQARAKRARAQIHKLLVDSPDTGSEFLERALAKEEELIGTPSSDSR